MLQNLTGIVEAFKPVLTTRNKLLAELPEFPIFRQMRAESIPPAYFALRSRNYNTVWLDTIDHRVINQLQSYRTASIFWASPSYICYQVPTIPTKKKKKTISNQTNKKKRESLYMNSRSQTLNQDCTKRFNSSPERRERKTRSNPLSLIVIAQVLLHLLSFVVSANLGIGTIYTNQIIGTMRMMEWSVASATNAYFDTLKLVLFFLEFFIFTFNFSLVEKNLWLIQEVTWVCFP